MYNLNATLVVTFSFSLIPKCGLSANVAAQFRFDTDPDPT